MAVPADTPVTTPVEALIVATPVELLVQLPPETVDVKVVVPATQAVWAPLSVPAVGGVVTVMVEAVEMVEQVGALKTTTV